MLLWLPAPKDVALLEERRALLQKVLAQLPPRQLRALEKIAFGGLTEVELAAEEGEPLARVRSELRAATRFLKHRRRAVVGSWTVTI
jgi:DNA-directed RNA polymerase specialized sigma24 family protein